MFKVKATGDHLQFQWQKNRSNLCEVGRYCDTSTGTLRILEVEKSDEGRYRCLVMNDTDKKGVLSEEVYLNVGKSVIKLYACTGKFGVAYKYRSQLVFCQIFSFYSCSP